MPVAVIDTLETVEVTQQYGHSVPTATGTSDFLLQVDTDRAGVWQSGQEIGARGVLGPLILQGILDRQPQLRAGSQQQAQMILCEALLAPKIDREHACGSIAPAHEFPCCNRCFPYPC